MFSKKKRTRIARLEINDPVRQQYGLGVVAYYSRRAAVYSEQIRESQDRQEELKKERELTRCRIRRAESSCSTAAHGERPGSGAYSQRCALPRPGDGFHQNVLGAYGGYCDFMYLPDGTHVHCEWAGFGF